MNWGNPQAAWLVLLLIPAALLEVRHERFTVRGRTLLGYPDHQPVYVTMRRILYAAAFCLLVAALCRPRWGSAPYTFQNQGIDIMVALDVSRSMLADDMVPDRLTAAKAALSRTDLFTPGDRVGLTAYAGSAFTVCPLTADHDTFRQVLSEASPGMIPVGGSDMRGLDAEVDRSFAGIPPENRLLVIIGDGEDHGGGAAETARRIRRGGTEVRAVLAGTGTGGLIPLPSGDVLRDRSGRPVRSRAVSATFRNFSEVTALSPDGAALAAAIASARTGLRERSVTRQRPAPVERFQVFLAAAAVSLAAAMLFPAGRQP